MERMPIIAKKPHDAEVQTKGQSRLAEEMALHRVVESFRQDGERICYDPYAVHFLGPDLRKYLDYCTQNPEEAQKRTDQMNRLFPGVQNSIITRVRYFDDIVKKAVDSGCEQLVILGAGYDTRAYRIAGIKEKVRVFEVDHPDTQSRKITRITEIFGTLPDHVVYVPIDFEKQNLAQQLKTSGYSPSKKTLFVMEGLVCYIDENAVKATLSFIVNNSGTGSVVLFDYFPESVVNGTCIQEVGKNMRTRAIEYGEPFRFGIREGTVTAFLEDKGFYHIHSVNCADVKNTYFHGKNADRQICDLFAFVSAEVKP
ncbi:MAG: class I SAM-dependent methyltransferase [Methanoregula sp.]|nr:class I SAM-dependent methyltransferase [Methanoregula sp.]MDD5187112.1 class I SAM-dependent methyltransferase [Methanoregula sp.]